MSAKTKMQYVSRPVLFLSDRVRKQLPALDKRLLLTCFALFLEVFFPAQENVSALTLSCLHFLIYVGFSLFAILISCSLKFEDVMKCSRPFGELRYCQCNYTG